MTVSKEYLQTLPEGDHIITLTKAQAPAPIDISGDLDGEIFNYQYVS
ncbi:MAG: hypothetical protein IIY78_08970 [Clostridia bacterium]|nr:hypothetical protein [Clostridia bacterium]